MSEQTPEQTPEEELDIQEPTEYTSDPEPEGPQDAIEEGQVAQLMRENDLDA